MASAGEVSDICAAYDYVAADASYEEMPPEIPAASLPKAEESTYDTSIEDILTENNQAEDEDTNINIVIPDYNSNHGNELSYYEYGYVDIVRLSAYTPAGLTTTHIVFTESELRGALNASGNRVIRLMNDIILADETVLPFAGASTTVHIYSHTDGSFAISRGTSESRHITLIGSRVLHLYNVALTRAPGPIRADGSITPGGPANNGGGVHLNASGTRLHMHAGSEISHNRYVGRGGGILISSGIVTMNEDSLIYSNRSNHPYQTIPGVNSGGGGGVAIDVGGTLNVNNGTIANNHAEHMGGGVSVGWTEATAGANFNINGIRLLNNFARASRCRFPL